MGRILLCMKFRLYCSAEFFFCSSKFFVLDLPGRLVRIFCLIHAQLVQLVLPDLKLILSLLVYLFDKPT